MPWVRKFFKKKQKVWVEVDDDGDLVTNDKGLVPMRYQNEEDADIYTVHPGNIGADAPSSSSSKKDGASSSGGGSKKKKAAAVELSDAAGPRRVSTEVPDDIAGLEFPEEGIIEVYTDGACQGNPGPCSYGLLLRAGFHYKEVSQYLGHGTNNIGELMAIRVALETIEVRDVPVRLHTDSSYAIGVLTKGWKVKANRELVAAIKAIIDEYDDLELIKVKGHAGQPLNERADTLAVSAIELARADGLVAG